MHSLKTRILSALCAALMLLSLAACGGKDDASNGGGAADGAGASADAAAPAAMSKDDYLAQVTGLNDAATAFTAATADFISAGLTNADDQDALNASIEKIRATKDAFFAFQAIDNPAEGYEDAHAALAKDCGDFGALIDEYCEVLLGALSGESDPAESDIQTRMETVINSLGESIGAIEAIG